MKAGLLYTLEEECIKQGHTYLSLDYAIEVTLDMLMDAHSSDSIDSKQLENILELLNEEQKIIVNNERVAIPSLYYSELKSVQNLYRIKTYKHKLKEIEQSDLQIHIGI